MKDKLAKEFIEAALGDKNYVIDRFLPALYAARRAVVTAVTSEDGLDGSVAERVEKKLSEAIKMAKFMRCAKKPKEKKR